ncbi:MAG: hypothetical protein R6X19_07560 [Kiritimatiellia bacterium]
MSLIQDALKRQQEEMNKKAAGETEPTGQKTEPPGQMQKIPIRTMNQPAFSQPPPSPAAPPPLPPVAAPPVEESSKALPLPTDDESRRPKALLPVLAAMILLFAVGFYFGWPYLHALLAGSTTPASSVQPDSVAVASVQSGEVAQTSASAQSVAGAATPQTNPPLSLAGSSATTGTLPGAESNLDPSASIAMPVPVKEPPPDLYARPPKPVAAEPVIWPPLKLTGCINMGKSAIAIINGQMVEPGQSIDEVLLVSVNKNKNEALMRLDGQERVLRVGETAR